MTKKILFVIFHDKFSVGPGTRRIKDLIYYFSKNIRTETYLVSFPYVFNRNQNKSLFDLLIIKFLSFFISFFVIFNLLFSKKYRQYTYLWFWPLDYTFLWIIPLLRLFGKKIIFDYNDNFYKLNTNKSFFRSIGSFLLYKLPQTIVPYIASFNLLNPYVYKSSSKFIKSKSILITSGFSKFKFKSSKFKSSSSSIKIGYFGGIRSDFDFDFVLNSLTKTKENFKLFLYGYNYDIKLPKDDRFILKKEIPHDKVFIEMNKMDMLIAPFRYGDFANCASPIKIFEYMACGKAILCAKIESVCPILISYHNSLLYSPSDESDFLNKFKLLLHDSRLRKHLGELAQKDSKKYEWREIIKKIEYFIFE